jgi:hypothetical protein
MSLGTDDELMEPIDEMECISATAAAHLDCDWENVFRIQAKQTTKETGLWAIKNLRGAHKSMESHNEERKVRTATDIAYPYALLKLQ